MIRGERINLRAVERTDAPLLHGWLNDPEVMRGWGAPDHVISLAEMQRRLEGWLALEADLSRPVCLIVETLDGEAIGQVLFSGFQPDVRSVELSLMIGDPARWGLGYGTDTLRAALDACFLSWGLHRVWLRSEAGNDRAHRLYARCGLTHEGTLRQAAFLDGRHQDVLLFAILASDWATSADPVAADRR